MCALLSTVGTLLRVPRPGNLPSTVDRRWVAAMVLNRDMGPIMRLPSLGELPAAALGALPAPRAPMAVADVGHQTGLPDARLRRALPCVAAAEGGMSLVVSVSPQHVGAVAAEAEAAHPPAAGGACPAMAAGGAPGAHPCCGPGRRGVGGHRFWACVRVERWGLDWIVVPADRLVRQQSRGFACYGVLRDYLRFVGPLRRAQRCSPGVIPPAPFVFVEVTAEPRIPG